MLYPPLDQFADRLIHNNEVAIFLGGLMSKGVSRETVINILQEQCETCGTRGQKRPEEKNLYQCPSCHRQWHVVPVSYNTILCAQRIIANHARNRHALNVLSELSALLDGEKVVDMGG